MIRERVEQLRRDTGQPLDPMRRGPVRLEAFFREADVRHVALNRLTLGLVGDYLQSLGFPPLELGDPGQPLAGFFFTCGGSDLAFVKSDDILTRRRFTAAHELGHALLHGESMGGFIADADIAEADEAESQREREANAFAAELLMPEEVCRARAGELRTRYGACPRSVLAYRLASELLVSKQAMDYRLKGLEVGDA
jgi:hypothetical protein